MQPTASPSSQCAPAELVLVSACLLGARCRYDGRDNQDLALERELESHALRPLPFCPEEHGQLGTPRPAAWMSGGDAQAVIAGEARVVNAEGRDVSAAFLAGARGALELCHQHNIRRAFLKERSPSCGVRQTHVDGVLSAGPGVTSQLLQQHGIEVSGVEGRRSSASPP